MPKTLAALMLGVDSVDPSIDAKTLTIKSLALADGQVTIALAAGKKIIRKRAPKGKKAANKEKTTFTAAIRAMYVRFWVNVFRSERSAMYLF
jgi:hypothetical protein